MKSIKDLLDEKSQTLHEDIAAAIVKYQTETGIKIIKIHYDESSYCTLDKCDFAAITYKLDIY